MCRRGHIFFGSSWDPPVIVMAGSEPTVGGGDGGGVRFRGQNLLHAHSHALRLHQGLDVVLGPGREPPSRATKYHPRGLRLRHGGASKGFSSVIEQGVGHGFGRSALKSLDCRDDYGKGRARARAKAMPQASVGLGDGADGPSAAAATTASTAAPKTR